MSTDSPHGNRSFSFRPYRFELLLVVAGIVILAVFAAVQRIMLGNPISPDLQFLGIPLDDVYIHTRFAQNLLCGFGYSFNPAFIISSDTSPLWVVLIAIAGVFTSHLELAAIALSMICYLMLGPGVYRVARDLFSMPEFPARVAGLTTVLSSRLIWSGMSGMETALAALLMLLVVEEHIRSRQWACLRPREALWLGLALLLRPEFMFVAALLVIDWVMARVRRSADVSAAPMAILLLAAIASPVFFLSIVTSGSVISHSSIVQGAGISLVPNSSYLWFALKIVASNNIIIFGLLVAGMWFLRKNRRYDVPIIIAIGLPILQAFVAPQFRHHGRYFFPVFPLIILIGIGAWNEIVQKMNFTPIVRKTIIVLIMIAGIIETGRWAGIEAESVRNINDQHLAVVRWLRQNIRPTDTLAVDDVGAIGYFLNKPVIDLTGLMTPSLWSLERNQDSVWTRSRKMGANLFVIYNRLNPPFYENHKDSLSLQQNFTVRLPLASSADTTMSIYRVKRTDAQ